MFTIYLAITGVIFSLKCLTGVKGNKKNFFIFKLITNINKLHTLFNQSFIMVLVVILEDIILFTGGFYPTIISVNIIKR